MSAWMILAAIGAALAVSTITALVVGALLRAARVLDVYDDSGEW